LGQHPSGERALLVKGQFRAYGLSEELRSAIVGPILLLPTPLFHAGILYLARYRAHCAPLCDGQDGDPIGGGLPPRDRQLGGSIVRRDPASEKRWKAWA